MTVSLIQSRSDVKGLLQGKVAIITGASRGIGHASARVFAAAGAMVVLAARNEAQLGQLAGEIEVAGGSALAVPTDVGDPESVARLVKQTVDRFGRLDAAFNNAGESHVPTPLGDMTVEDFDKTVKANLRGVFLSMKYEIPAMLENGGGAIVNMSSTAGLQGARGLGDYVAAKHGVIGLTKTAALDYADKKLRVNAIAPGPIMNDRLRQLKDPGPVISAVPMRRIGQPDEVGRLAAWLCSDQASFITGAIVSIDGGRLAGSG